VNPKAFIPLLEESGDIIPVGRWALSTACAQGVMWHDKGYRFSVSVNISIKQLQGAGFETDVEEAWASSGFDPSLLVLEFPLSVIDHSDEDVTRKLAQLQSQGVRLAVDDFAPNNNALTILEGSPFTIVKLDRKFIADMTTSSSAEPFVHQLVQLAKAQSLQIIASGIEDAEQRRRLQIDEVNIGQGFLFSKPHEAADIDRFLEDFSIFSGKPL
jgi:EAL domain-containing protein (putative c-di-GMP-specific phosphodiesterase class I)